MDVDVQQRTRQARSIYAGGIPPGVSETDLMLFFTDIIERASGMRWDSPPVLNINVNAERVYTFIELCSMELAAGCMELDGIQYDHPSCPSTIIRIRRPDHFRGLLPSSCVPIKLDLQPLGLIQPPGTIIQQASATSLSKIFVGGLPYDLSDSQFRELLGSFGPIKSLNQVLGPGGNTKGFGFCEYVSMEHGEAAIAELHNMPCGDKTLTSGAWW
ncbi:hypothetical protein B484DRAFT_402203 [Ochromonadaceae sp. CCMP2298]|nr:hypothetical protein B484DRAFT_402203 [Ochromonadaceae sp. CCMP2298]